MKPFGTEKFLNFLFDSKRWNLVKPFSTKGSLFFCLISKVGIWWSLSVLKGFLIFCLILLSHLFMSQRKDPYNKFNKGYQTCGLKEETRGSVGYG